MKLKFKHQKYQDDAVNSLISCFYGQKKGYLKNTIARLQKTTDKGSLFEKTEDIEIISYGNQYITLSEVQRAKNIREVQKKNGIDYTNNEPLDEFSIEMETGTGKTFTYIKTMYELNKEYGWSKFIVMVPSIAIREGVQKTFDVTQEYFQELYHQKIRYFVYNSSKSSNIPNINTFASDESIQVMIINYQAFSSKGAQNRRIYEELDELQSRKPIDVIKSVHPILIIDEPQKFGDKTEELFKEFNPLFKIRYSATHKKNKEYNKIYRLDAIDAYNQKLVKKINVKGIEVLHNKSKDTYMFLESINISQKREPQALMEIEVKSTSGTTRKLLKISSGDDLYLKSGKLQQYKGYVVSEISGIHNGFDKVFFTNGEEIEVGQATGNIDEAHLARIQIRETIKSHLEKEKELSKDGIKVLSLFFIDEVAKYKYYEDGKALKGEYAKIFEEEYNKEVSKYQSNNDEYQEYLNSFETGKIHAGYFSIDKKGHEVNSNINDKKEYLSFDEDAYNLIMKDKERLLSLEEPVRFIFSHSALREGWDNPNIFQICTLKHSNSEISKRQEIGRGLRICVNNDGERMDYSVLDSSFHSVNTLSVIASESYDSFAESLQAEISSELLSRPQTFDQELFVGKILTSSSGDQLEISSKHFLDLVFFNCQKEYVNRQDNYKITDKFLEDLENDNLEVIEGLKEYKESYIALMKHTYLANTINLVNDERKENIKNLVPNSNFAYFQDLWQKINTKTIYEVDFDQNILIQRAITAINENLHIAKLAIRITEGEQKDKISTISINNKEAMTVGTSKTEIIEDAAPSQVEYDLIGEIAKDTELTRKTIIEILSKISSEKFAYYKYNPEEFIRRTSNLIKEVKAITLIDGIKYYPTSEKYSDDIFIINNARGELGKNAIPTQKHIYDYLIADSKTEIEFAKQLESGEVLVYAKLPNNFKIPTPVGNYNPDWAIIFNNNQFNYLYFIAETKGSMNESNLRAVEMAKIACAKKHFQCLCQDEVGCDIIDNYDSLLKILLDKKA